MNIRIIGIALIAIFVTFACTNTVQVTQAVPEIETVQDSKTVQGAETVEGVELAQGTDIDPDDPDATTCKMIAKTGSRVKTKICATNREWKQNEKEQQSNVHKLQNRTQYLDGEG